MVRLRSYDYSPIIQKHKLKALYFLAPLFGTQEIRVRELLFGIRQSSNEQSINFKMLEADIKMLLLLEYADTVITFLENPREEVEKIMNLAVCPYINGHGGTIILQEVYENFGVIAILLKSAPQRCPCALTVMKYGTEVIFKEYLPWVTRVELSNPVRQDGELNGYA